MIISRWSLVAGRWSLVAGRWSLIFPALSELRSPSFVLS
jgi:hypothetical protein